MVSGGIKGGDELVGKPALLDIAVGKGRVIAFDFDPIHRYQTRVGLPPGLERDPQLERPAPDPADARDAARSLNRRAGRVLVLRPSRRRAGAPRRAIATQASGSITWYYWRRNGSHIGHE